MRKTQVLFVAPGVGNGGIRSWAKKMLATFNDDEFELVHIGVGNRRAALTNSFIKRMIDGLLDLREKRKAVRSALKNNSNIAIMHITTSGSLGTLRDYVLAKCCKSYGVKTIMHCHYGCISEDYTSKGIMGFLLRKTMRLYDQIWVLDSRSYKTLSSDQHLLGKVFITPNSIHVPLSCDLSSKGYKDVAYVGILLPSKGLYELIEAVKRCQNDTVLTIVGPGEDEVVRRMREIAGDDMDNKIRYIGPLPNDQAVSFIKTMDIIALPTYYKYEAFPISILEAMSYGKMVISTPRAAIKDMLTAVDGTECGCLVQEKSVDDIVKALAWCQTNTELADDRCKKAYEKVHSYYRMDVVYDLYRELYRKLLSKM